MHINLSQAEKELMTRLLKKELEEIRSELHHAQVHDYKESIRDREALARQLLGKLTA